MTRTSGPGMTPCMKWLLRARPGDYMLALSLAGASLPVVGKRLEPLGAVTAMGIWAARQAPEFMSVAARDWFTPGANEVRRRDRASTRDASIAALHGIVSADELNADWPQPDGTPPVWGAVRHRRHLYRRSVHYGDNPAQLLAALDRGFPIRLLDNLDIQIPALYGGSA